jgi:hypothetical protein
LSAAPSATVLMRTCGAVHDPAGAIEQVVPQLVAPPMLIAPEPPLLVPAVPLLVPPVPLLVPAVAAEPPPLGPEPPLALVPAVPMPVVPAVPCPEPPPPGVEPELDVEQPATPALASIAPARTASAAVGFSRGIAGRVGRIVMFFCSIDPHRTASRRPGRAYFIQTPVERATRGDAENLRFASPRGPLRFAAPPFARPN